MEPKKKTAQVTIKNNSVRVYCSEKDYTLIDICKCHGMRWDRSSGTWVLMCGATHGSPEHRAANITADLLASEFNVSAEEHIITSAVNGEYEPRYPRWIHANSKINNWVCIEFFDDFAVSSDDIIDLRLKDDFYNERRYYANPLLWREIQDFANANGFKITDNSKKLLDTAREKELSIVLFDSVIMPQQPDIDYPHTPDVDDLMDD